MKRPMFAGMVFWGLTIAASAVLMVGCNSDVQNKRQTTVGDEVLLSEQPVKLAPTEKLEADVGISPPPEKHIAPNITISGRVTDKDTGEPIAGAFINLIAQPSDLKAEAPPAITDENGDYLIKPTIAAASFPALVVQKAGYAMTERTLWDGLGYNIEFNSLHINRDIVMGKAVSVSGHVLSRGGIPHADATVYLQVGGFS